MSPSAGLRRLEVIQLLGWASGSRAVDYCSPNGDISIAGLRVDEVTELKVLVSTTQSYDTLINNLLRGLRLGSRADGTRFNTV